jgi:hypothetical protein
MFEQLVGDAAPVDEVGLAELRAALWDDPLLHDDDLEVSDAVWVEREKVAHALWEQEYGTVDGAMARIARYGADEARCVGSKVRAVVDFAHHRVREAAAAIVQERRGGASQEEIRTSVQVAEESAAAELGLWMHIGTGAAGELMDFATGLARRLPKTLDALEAGSITERQARILFTETRDLDIAKTAWVERQTLPKASEKTPASFKRLVRRRVEQADADALLKRHAAALKERRVTLTSAGDGMSWFSALLPTEEAMAVFGVVDTFAHEREPGDERTLDQRRADATLDLVTRPGQQDPRVGYVVHLHGNADGTDGTGQTAQATNGDLIPAPRAREKADLTVHHPAVPVDIAAILADYNSRADVYKPSAKLKRAIRARDRHCRFPGCRRPAHRCELDHTVAFEIGGRTIYTNLSALCKHHHRIKHMPGWTCTQDEAGVLTWTTPSGQTYLTRPPPALGDEPPDFVTPAPARPEPADDIPPF